nr:MAG TPA: hypothetical protein [Caudoviricetes sp.]
MKELKKMFQESIGLIIRILLFVLPIVLLVALYHILF